MTHIQIIELIALIIGGYFIGNISFARIISKLNKSDITKSGSGNPGTMNMLRTYGVKLGLITLILDVLKGVVPSLIGFLLFKGYGEIYSLIALYSAGLSAIIGHIFPVCFKFKGGKGVACALGVFAVSNPLWLLLFFVIAFIYIWYFDYGSVGSLLIVSALTIISGIKLESVQTLDITLKVVVSLLLFAIFFLTWFAHRNNIIRLLVGKENKANLQKSFKKALHKEKKQIRTEYKQEKSEIKQDIKEEKAKYKQERKEFKTSIKSEKERFKQHKKEMKKETKNLRKDYHSEKRSLNEYNKILETVVKEQDIKEEKVQNIENEKNDK